MSKVNERTSFEDALTETGFGIFNYLQLLICAILVSAMVCESFAISYLVVGSACELGTDSVQQGLMAAMPLLGIILTSHFWGYLADTRGRKKVLLLSLVLGFITGTLSAFSPNWIVFCILKLMSSSAVSGTFALSMTLLSECTPEPKRSSMVILANSIFMCVPGLMAILTIPILPMTFSYPIQFLGIFFNSWRFLSLLFTFPCALGVLGMYINCESPKYLISVGRDEEALEVLKMIFMLNNRRPKEDFKIKSIVLEEGSSSVAQSLWSSLKSQTIPLLKPPLLRSTLVLSSAIICVYFGMNSLLVWLPTITDSVTQSVSRGQTNLTFCQMIMSNAPSVNTTVVNDQPCTLDPNAMYMVFFISILFTSLNVVLTAIVNYFGRKKIIIFIQLIAGLSGIIMNSITGWVICSILFIVYLSPMMVMGLITSYSVDTFPTYLRAMAVCLTLMLGRGSAIVGINIMKQMLFTNCEGSFYLFSSITLVGVIVAFFLPADKTFRKTKQESSS